ncbi:MAG TPA: nucleotidyltransferase domain-containing protein, partial [Bacteroidales bacterium]|nr:nucleotidyltransferase domain-containing protein [Bacteroidales bacterium]
MIDIINFAVEYCSPHRLLLLSKSGSHLHGTETEDSDLDYKGVFLPDINFCLMNETPRYINFSTGSDNTKNSNEDI